MPLPSCQKTLAVLCLHPQQLWAWLLPHPKRDSICVLKSEPQTLGSSSIPTVEHMRGTSGEITWQYIYKFTEIDWKWMLGSRKREKKVNRHLEVIYKTVLHLVTKSRFPKHVNISLGAAEVIGSIFPIFFLGSQEKESWPLLNHHRIESTLSWPLTCCAGNLQPALSRSSPGCIIPHYTGNFPLLQNRLFSLWGTVFSTLVF